MEATPRAHATARLPVALYGAAAVRELDRRAIEAHGIPGETLMARAGAAVYRTLRARWPEARRLLIVCGLGNNAGDGYVVARLAREDGREPRVLQVGDAGRLRGDALAAAQAARAAGVPVEAFASGAALAGDVAVDALFGTGLDRPLEGVWADAVRAVGASGLPVLAVDLPSGLHADTGRVLGAAVSARATVTFIALKPGLLTGEGPAHCGEVLFHGLGVPEPVYAGVPVAGWRLDAQGLAARHLARRARTAHKGHYGHVLVVGGDRGFAGAARLAAEAAGRAGAGLVTLATRAAHVPAIAAPRPELMCRGVEAAEELAPLLERATVVAIGPGLSREDWGQGMLRVVLASGLPRVVDADALALLAARGPSADPQVLTPHPGEAARMLGVTPAEVQADRLGAAVRLREAFGGVVVLKGAGTVVCSPGGRVAVCGRGNPGMASGGMGDVLTGVIAGLLAQGLSPGDAAELGVCVHARAAELAAGAGERGLLAGDLFGPLRQLVNPV
jgi:NAD(P)H-hydrate epimerase